jgi:long-chain acyl-CoA synthetase
MTSTHSPTAASTSTEEALAAAAAAGMQPGPTRDAAHAPTIVAAFALTSAAAPDAVAIRTKDDAQTLTWAQWDRRARELAGGLHKLGLRRGDTLALMLGNRPEFHVADLAAVLLGATPFSIYQTYAANQIEFVVADAGARIAVVERQYLSQLLEARRNLPALEHVILVDPQEGEGATDATDATTDGGVGGESAAATGADDVLTLADVEAAGRDEAAQREVEEASAQVQPQDVLTLIYTSGTTGPPKGVQLSHANLMSTVRGVEALVPFEPGARVISWLPAAHVAERAAHHYVPIVFGLQVTCCPDPRQVVAYLPEVRPQWFFAVPRIWEKLKAGLETMRAGLPAEQREPVERALEAATEKVRIEQRGEQAPAELAARVAVADEQIFAGLRTMLGLDQIQVVNVGAAPTPLEVLEFFHAIGIPLAELWGMSETCGAGCVNPPWKIKLGTVGPPAPGVEIRIAEDGEVLVRGETVMVGYRGAPEKTAEAIDPEGWLHTGDVGALDEDGYLRIVDRKKELIINAAGKNMSPANIEATIKSVSPLIGQVCAIGDARPYNTALIVLDADFAPLWGAQHGLEGRTLEQLADEPAVRAAVQEAVDAANSRLARVEQIKKFTIVRGDWLPGEDELTPTMKLKRKPIAAKYVGEIEGMYG